MSITSRITSIEGHITDAYNGLAGLGADLTGIDKNIDNIASVLDDIYDSMPQVSGEGTSLTLDDTRVGKIKSTLKGNTSQTTYSGKNLLENTFQSQTADGITLTKNEDGSLSFSGTATRALSVSGIFTNEIIFKAGTTYTFSLGNKQAGYGVYLQKEDGTNVWYLGVSATNSSLTITPTEDTSIAELTLHFPNGNTVNGTIYPMVEVGSTVTTYEPYVGGTASPNPSYPQPVNVVSGDNEITVCGKNMFDDSIVTNLWSEYFANKIVSTNGANLHKFNCKQGDTFTLKATYDSASGSSAILIQFFDSNDNSLGRYASANDTTLTLTKTAPANTSYAYMGRYLSTPITIQLEKNNQATTYEPYQGNTYNIDLPVENILDITSSGSSIGGVPFTIENGIIKINGTTSSSTASYYFNTFRTKSESAMFSIEVTGYTDKSSGNSALILQQSDDGTTGWSTLSELSLNSVYAKQNSVTLDSSKYYRLRWYVDNNTFTNATIKVQLEYGNKKNSFTPYGTTPIELCKIGNYQDYFYKDSDKWYLHKEIGKVVLDGTYTFFKSSTSSIDRFGISFDNIGIGSLVNSLSLSSHLVYKASANANPQTFYISTSNSTMYIDFSNYGETTLSDFTTWLSANTPAFYLILATPTNTEITDTNLINQLNALEQAKSKENQTNISQVNNDLPFVISASALKEWQESTSLNSTLSMVNPLSLGNTLNTQEIDNNTQPIEVDNIEPLEEEENEES